ncbi:MAG: hypothetical protein ACOX6E_06995 [Syntrophomonadaceae bacterium]
MKKRENDAHKLANDTSNVTDAAAYEDLDLRKLEEQSLTKKSKRKPFNKK